MRMLSVDVYEDSSRLEGGHAVIRLNGVDTVPDSLTFRIKPVDSAQQGEGGWPNNDRLPLVTRLTPAGAELVVGPEIVESPHFLPGTLTAIEVIQLGVRGEFLWPRIPPLVRPKRRHLIGAKAPRDLKAQPGETVHFEEAHDASSALTPSPVEPAAVVERVLPPVEFDQPSIDFGEFAQSPSLAANTTASLATALPREGDATIAAGEFSKPDVVWSDSSRAEAPHWRRMAAVLGGIGLLAAAAFYLAAGRVGGPAAATSAAGRESELVNVLSVGTTSPRGAKTKDRSLQALLEDADAMLHAPDGRRDTAEAAFLLRRYLMGALSEERTLRALTQLGSIYAEPDGNRSPDYARARMLWELAATLGDPIAMCFLASLHEHGLGLGTNKPAALQWYLRAKDAGSCTSADAAIARLRK